MQTSNCSFVSNLKALHYIQSFNKFVSFSQIPRTTCGKRRRKCIAFKLFHSHLFRKQIIPSLCSNLKQLTFYFCLFHLHASVFYKAVIQHTLHNLKKFLLKTGFYSTKVNMVHIFNHQGYILNKIVCLFIMNII